MRFLVAEPFRGRDHARYDSTGRPVEPGPGHVPVDLYNVLRHGFVFWFPIAVFRFGE